MPTHREMRLAMQRGSQSEVPMLKSIVVMKRTCWATEEGLWEPRAVYDQQSRARAEFLAASYGTDRNRNPCGKLIELPDLSHDREQCQSK